MKCCQIQATFGRKAKYCAHYNRFIYIKCVRVADLLTIFTAAFGIHVLHSMRLMTHHISLCRYTPRPSVFSRADVAKFGPHNAK